VISGKKCPTQASAEQVAAATVRCLKRHVPAAVPGIMFLSGGQTPAQAALAPVADESARAAALAAVVQLRPRAAGGRARRLGGKSANVAAGQKEFQSGRASIVWRAAAAFRPAWSRQAGDRKLTPS